jgi:hypothetical protein
LLTVFDPVLEALVSELVGLEFTIESRSTDAEDAHDLGEIAVGLDQRLFDGTALELLEIERIEM